MCKSLRLEYMYYLFKKKLPGGLRDVSLRPYSRFSRPESLLFLPSGSSVVRTRLSGPHVLFINLSTLGRFVMAVSWGKK
jgi:hypothetical protein